MNNLQRVNITITLPAVIHDLPEGVTFEQVAQAMLRDRWDEGRYPFHVEMIQEGLEQEVHWAIRAVVYERLREIYGGEMVPDCSSQTARWVIEGDKIKGPFVDMMGHTTAAKIEACDA